MREVHHRGRDAGQFPLPVEVAALDSTAHGRQDAEPSREPLGQRHRQNEAWRYREGGARGPASDRLTAGKAVSGFERQGGRGRDLAPRRHGRRLPRLVVHDAGGRRPGAPDRLRQRGEPAAVQSHGEAEGSGYPERAGRIQGSAAAPVAHRKSAALAGGRRARPVPGVGSGGPVFQRQKLHPAAVQRRPAKRDRARVHFRAGHRHGRVVRRLPGASDVAARPA